MGACDAEMEPEGVFRHPVGEFVGPFDGNGSGSIQVFIPADGVQFRSGVEAVEVEVEQGETPSMVFMNKGKGGAANGGAARDAFCETLDKVGFSRAEVSDQGQCVKGFQGLAKAFS